MSPRPTVAVVGAGISGLTAAYLLRDTHDVTVFEAQHRLGGHTHTHDVTVGGAHTVPVDTGFIVHNDRTYPLLRRLFGELGVATRVTEMSMSIRCDGCGLAFAGGRGVKGIFAQRRRLLDRRFWRLLLDVRRFQRLALAHLDRAGEHGVDRTFGQFLREHGFGDYFVQHYAIPVVSCVWSTGHADAMRYPARYLFAFLRNHGFLAVRDAPTWRTVEGGSRAYVTALADRLDDVRVGVAVVSVARKPGPPAHVLVHDAAGGQHEFDQVVVATHADEALALLGDATELETAVLGAFGYSRNETTLHRDASLLPRPRQARASWNYRLDGCAAAAERTQVTYWMNRLQGHPERDPLLVTLNADRGRPLAGVVETMVYTHPVYTPESVAAQARLAELNTERVAFAGAYHGWGFHEDGCRAGVDAAAALGTSW